ncbi:MAG TPA: hypothetical protein VFV72_03260 [Candidatus Limnocylindrales bacterium]|nr:hypothetical protein [Candidatus Limnocylindrales bacterium]
MTARHPDELIDAFLDEGRDDLPDRIFDAVRGDIHRTRQRVVIGPWREPHMSNVARVALAAAAVIAVLVGASRLLPSAPGPGSVQPSPTPTPTAVATPTVTPSDSLAPGAFGGTVGYKSDGLAATTEVDGVASGGTLTGTVISTGYQGTHKVRLGCASRSGDTWALGGTVEESTVPGETAGPWSAVIVREGTPQQIAIWLSDPNSPATDCESWLALNDFSSLDGEPFAAVESGVLVPPPDLAP